MYANIDMLIYSIASFLECAWGQEFGSWPMFLMNVVVWARIHMTVAQSTSGVEVIYSRHRILSTVIDFSLLRCLLFQVLWWWRNRIVVMIAIVKLKTKTCQDKGNNWVKIKSKWKRILGNIKPYQILFLAKPLLELVDFICHLCFAIWLVCFTELVL